MGEWHRASLGRDIHFASLCIHSSLYLEVVNVSRMGEQVSIESNGTRTMAVEVSKDIGTEIGMK
jgi:hypothetical protein